MAQISAALVKQLREMTDSPMMECKKALVEAEGDIEKAVDVLRKLLNALVVIRMKVPLLLMFLKTVKLVHFWSLLVKQTL